MDKIIELKNERDRQRAIIEAAQARIEKINAVLDAYRLLVHEHVLPEPDMLDIEDQQAEQPIGSDTVVKIRSAVEHLGGEPFAVSDIVADTDFSRQTVRRVLNDWTKQGNIRVVEQGFRRKPTIYKAVESE